MSILKISDHIQVKIKIQNPSQESAKSSKALSQNLRDWDVLWIFKIKRESKTSEHGCIKDQWPNLNQNQDAQPQ